MTANEVYALKDKVLSGGELSEEEIYALCDAPSAALRQAAREVTAAFAPKRFDSCSIINARSGKCSENCKWCAQSAHFNTGCQTYPIVNRDECMHAARLNHSQGVRHFSLVASGRSVKGQALKDMVSMLHDIKKDIGIDTCASLGLLTRPEMETLHNSGVNRYHCNLETAPSHFATLCTTHTIEDKLATIEHARALGMEICSGGIIGMGETKRQRAEFAITLRRAKPMSIPINILSPIPGTPLENTEPISDDDILDCIALFRLAHPRAILRFAGGRARLSRDVQLQALKIGINGATVGDLLTTIGSTVDEDRQLTTEAGYQF